jgi:ketosteroid isomerase-like protein
MIGDQPINGEAADERSRQQETHAGDFRCGGNPDPEVRDRSLFTASLADDATWVVTGQYSWSRTFSGKQSILNDLHGHVRSLLVERARTIAHRFIADGDHVAVEAGRKSPFMKAGCGKTARPAAEQRGLALGGGRGGK